MFTTSSKKKYKKTSVDPITLEHSTSRDSDDGPKVGSPSRYKKTHKPPPIPLEGSKSSSDGGKNEQKEPVRERQSEPSATSDADAKADKIVDKGSSLPKEPTSPVSVAQPAVNKTTSSDPTNLEPSKTVKMALEPVQEANVGKAGGQSGAQGSVGGSDVPAKKRGDRQGSSRSGPKGGDGTAESNGEGGRVVVLSPLFSFLLQDSSILFLLSIPATAMTYVHLDEITADGGGVPLKVAALWVAFALLLGSMLSSRRQAIVVEQHLLEIERLRADVIAAKKSAEEEQKLDEAVQRTSAKLGGTPPELSSFRRRHTLLQTMARVASVRVLEKPEPKKEDMILPEGFSCELQNEPKGDIELADFLMNRLVKVPTHHLSIDKKRAIPICPQRGMDIWLSDAPDDWLCENKLLLRCGLRAKPTIVVNLVMPWANIGVFYEMPSWVKKFSDISVEDGDRDDIKAFKNFLKGDDEYKKNRLQFLPYLRDGPLAMRVVAPKKKEIIGRATMLSQLRWRQHDETTDRFGRKMCAILEGSLDVTSDPMSRGVASVMRRYLPSLTMDVAFVVDKPELQKEYEPSAVIGYMNIHNIDVTTCPVMPQKSEEEMVEYARASVAMRR